LNGSEDANSDIASSGDFELDNIFWIEPCLLFGDSLFGHHGKPFIQPMVNAYAETFSEDHVKQVNCAVTHL